MDRIIIFTLLLTVLTWGAPSNSLIASAQEGNLSAQEELGEYYFNEAQEKSTQKRRYQHPDSKREFDEELESNRTEALRWLHIAVRNGSSKSFYYLGSYFNSCCWGEENADSAFYYWDKGSEAGDKYSQKQLAYLYLNGIGCRKDLKKAHILSWKSFLKGNMSTPLIWIAKLLDIDSYIS